jgi:hypothetical protein
MVSSIFVYSTFLTPARETIPGIPGLWWFGQGVGLLLLLVSVVLTLRETRIRARLRLDGIIAQGRIIKHRIGQGRAISFYYVTYSYVCNGATFAREQLVSKRHYRAWPENMGVIVTCLPLHPRTARILNDSATRTILLVLTLWSLFVNVSVAGLIISLR